MNAEERIVLEEFKGVLDVLNEGEDDSYFTVSSVANGEVLRGQKASSFFIEKNMREGQRFILRVVQYGNSNAVCEIEPVPLRKPTPEDMAEIEMLLRLLPDDDSPQNDIQGDAK